MSLLLHAITTRTEAAPSASGFRGGALLRADADTLVAWYSTVPEGSASFARADVLDAHRTVSGVFAVVAACLPTRFPTLVDDRTALRGLLDAHAAEWLQRLERVRDACELAVTAVWRPLEQESTPPVTATPTAATTAATPGRRYLIERERALRASEQRRTRAEAIAEEIEQRVSEDVLDARRRVCPSPTVALSLALLVPRARTEAALGRLPRAADDVRILVNGPWPPYTFAGLGSEHGDAR